ncbi:non-ribosomal peptide synthetase [Actinacidiphila rubida]|uniref:Amino acid adenylation domain-containing protein n=1 Tax=Actinacidiphila rubida TaxID=310780 RepID=A0A1H8EHP6_9ACTN|nr:non-ribosomal peptide synthetase [Actinacidiphila rubida]SEN18910.1 amino acid adenylation domain-containing protein [Actinacidiphila rubida]
MIAPSYAQSRLWFLNRLEGGATYNLPVAVRLTGPLSADALEAALGDVTDRHHSLRTRFPELDGGPVQEVVPAAQGRPVLRRARTSADRLASVQEEFAEAGFDLEKDLPLRALLLELAADDHVLVLVMHHIACDGWSMRPLWHDLSVAYAARRAGHEPGWEPLPVQYADYAEWQRDLLGAPDDPDALQSRQLAYWRDVLAGAPEELALPADRPRPAVSGRGAGRAGLAIPADLHGRLAGLARAHGVTLFMVLQAAVATLLCRMGAGTDVPLGTPVAGRTDEALDDLVGFFVNTLVIRTDLSGSPTFADLLARVRERSLGALDHQDVPFQRLVEELAPSRSTSRHPLTQVLVVLQNNEAAVPDLPGIAARPYLVGRPVAKTDLTFEFGERAAEADGRPAGIDGAVFYATDLFDAGTADSLATRLLRLLQAVAADPARRVGSIDLLSEEEWREILAPGAEVAPAPAAAATLPGRFEARAAGNPHAPAVVDADGTRLTYAELNSRANRLARLLVACGAGPEGRVAVALPRSAELAVALLAVLKCGAAYVPLDPDYPADRVAYMLADSAPAVLVTSRGTVAAGRERGMGAPGREQPAPAPGGERPAPVTLLLDDPATADRLHRLPDGDLTDAERTSALLPSHPAYTIYTSGSTGRPKGVLVPHASVLRLFTATDAWFGPGPEDVWTWFHSFAFDFSVWEMWGALLHGGLLVVVPVDVARSPAEFLALLARERVTVLNQTPSAFYQLDRADAQHPALSAGLALRTVVFGGEALDVTRLSGWHERHGDRAPRLVNMYGITETTVHVSYKELAALPTGGGAVPGTIGRGIPDLRVHVLDDALLPCPPGVPGEMYVSGAGLARGYLGRPDLTAGRFVADPFGPPGQRMYRSGDLAKWSAAGELEYLGRSDDQVKIRGFRIELGEIESVVAGHDAVTAGTVLVREDRPGDLRLVAYVTTSGPHAPADRDRLAAALRAHCTTLLPGYMVPSAFVVVDAFPLTVNGKLDRRALPAPEAAAPAPSRAPGTPEEEVMCGLFAEVLGAGSVGADDHFFDLGGHSLLAVRLISRIRAVIGVDVEVRTLFEAPTPAMLLARIAGGAGAAAGTDAATRPVRGPRPPVIPLSSAQRRLWFMAQWEGPSPTYNMPAAYRLTGPLDTAALRDALADLAARHESLRTVFPATGGEPRQLVLPADQARPRLPVRAVARGGLDAAVAEASGRSFDIANEPPLHAELLALSPTDHVLVLVLHHIAGDGWSMKPLLRDLATAYTARLAGRPPGWPELPLQYADYAVWQRDLLDAEDDPGSAMSRRLDAWRRQLAGLPEDLPLPTDRPRPAVPSYVGAGTPVEIAPELHARLVRLARSHGASLFMVVQAAFAALLSRLGGGTDIPLGTPAAGRRDDALHDLVGMFVNMLVLRTDLSGDPRFTDLLARVRETDLAAYDGQDVPFERLVELLNPGRSTARHPLFQVMCALDNTAPAELSLPGLEVRERPGVRAAARFDLSLSLTEHTAGDGGAGGVRGVLQYATDLFDPATAEAMAARLVLVLTAVADDPTVRIGALGILPEHERETVLAAWNDTGTSAPARTLPDLFQEQVRADPDATAVVCEGERLTYGEVDARANRLARLLMARGAGPERTVALALPRSAEAIVALLAVAKSGAAYLPLDTEYPAERLAFMLDDARPLLVLTTAATAGRLPCVAAAPHLLLDAAATAAALGAASAREVTDGERRHPLLPAHPAYVIYTSGSTGRPKGVQVTHRGISGFATTQRELLDIGPRSRVLHFASLGFDAATAEICRALLSGATLVVSRRSVFGRHGLAETVRTEGVTHAFLQPALLAAGADLCLDGVRTLTVGGEACPPSLVEQWAGGRRMLVFYGPTEATVLATHHLIGPGDADHPSAALPIGRPLAGMRAYVLDARLQPVPAGVTGELHLAGGGLARGYLDRPQLTAERFVACPYGEPGERMYRTGDLVRWSGDGELHFVGRTDDQVKLRGFRIELGEIESVLARLDEVAQAVVVVREDRPGDRRLVAYVLPAPGAVPDPARLRAFAARTLPEHMVPSAVVPLTAMPTTANGKLDRRALPAPEVPAPAASRAPRTADEEILCGLFAEVLGVDGVGVDDHFFELGGHSLLATRLIARVRAVFATEADVRTVFEAPTVALLASRLGAAPATSGLRAVLPIRDAGAGEPLFCLPPAGGLSWAYARLLGRLPAEQRVYGLQAPGTYGEGPVPEAVEAIAADYARRIRRIQPHGPYRLLGWSFGGVNAHAVAVRLQEEGERVELLALLDAYPHGAAGGDADEAALLADLARSLGVPPSPADVPALSPEWILHRLRADDHPLRDISETVLHAMLHDYRIARASRLTHAPGVFRGDVLAFTAAASAPPDVTATGTWSPYVDGRITEHRIACRHEDMLHPAHVGAVAAAVAGALRSGGEGPGVAPESAGPELAAAGRRA